MHRALPCAVVLAALLLAASSVVDAGDDGFPARALKIVVPFAPGTGADVLARTLGAKLSEQWRKSVIIENREGAGGLIGARAVLQAPNDGYTLLLAASAFAVSPLLHDPIPYDPLHDFVPVSQLAILPLVLVVHAGAPVSTARELVAYTKARSGQVNYASSGVGTPSELEMELLKSRLGMDIQEVPYKSAVQAMTDLAAGQVLVFYSVLPPILPHIKSGRARALGIASTSRMPQVPGVPTMWEALALPGYEAHVWYGIVVRDGTPLAIVNTLNSAIANVLHRSETKEVVTSMGGEVVTGTPQDFRAYLQRDVEKWSGLVKRLGIKIE